MIHDRDQRDARGRASRFASAAVAMLATASALLLAACSDPKPRAESPREKEQRMTLSEKYPGPWREEFHLGITKALARNRITGCGQYKFREHWRFQNEFVVHCTADGKQWTSYLVFDLIEKVHGPYPPEAELE